MTSSMLGAVGRDCAGSIGAVASTSASVDAAKAVFMLEYCQRRDDVASTPEAGGRTRTAHRSEVGGPFSVKVPQRRGALAVYTIRGTEFRPAGSAPRPDGCAAPD